MSEETSTPQWDMLGFTRVVADALDDTVAAHLRALEDSISNIDSTRERMATAQQAYFALREAQDVEVAKPVVCLAFPHRFEGLFLVPSVPMNGVERDPKYVLFSPCSGCGSLKVQTTNTGDPGDTQCQIIIRK